MKTNWLKQNLLLLIGGVIVMALMAVTLWFVHQANIRKNEVEADLTAAQEQIEQLQHNKPYPSPDNIKELQNDNEKVQRLYTALREAVIRKPLIAPDLHGEVDFVGFLRNHQRDWRAAADAAQVKLPDNFSFGFDRYDNAFPCRLPPLPDQDCQQLLKNLAKQVLAVNEVCRVAFASGIDQLLSIRRIDLEGGQTSADALPPSPPLDSKVLFHVLPVEIKFGANEKALRAFLNNIVLADEFLVVRNLNLATETYVVNLPLSAALPAFAPGLTAPEKRGTETGTQQQETRQRLVVTARVELIEFGTEQPAVQPAAISRGNP